MWPCQWTPRPLCSVLTLPLAATQTKGGSLSAAQTKSQSSPRGGSNASAHAPLLPQLPRRPSHAECFDPTADGLPPHLAAWRVLLGYAAVSRLWSQSARLLAPLRTTLQPPLSASSCLRGRRNPVPTPVFTTATTLPAWCPHLLRLTQNTWPLLGRRNSSDS